MNWLLWRECRLSRLILGVGAFLFVIPYIIAVLFLLWPKEYLVRELTYSRAFGAAAIYSIVLSQLTVALLGGIAMAGERADRSAQFMAYLPVSRARRLASKLALATSVVALVWVLNLAILFTVSDMTDSLWMRGGQEFFRTTLLTAITGLVFYCVGWFISSFQSSTTFAVVGAIVTPWIVMLVIGALAWLMDVEPSDDVFFLPFIGICVTLSAVCFGFGTWYYLKRVEP